MGTEFLLFLSYSSFYNNKESLAKTCLTLSNFRDSSNENDSVGLASRNLAQKQISDIQFLYSIPSR